MRVLVWTDIFFQYLDSEPHNIHVGSLFDLISQGEVQGCILQKTYQEVARDEALQSWIGKYLEVYPNNVAFNLKKRNIKIIIARNPNAAEFEFFKAKNIKIISAQEFLNIRKRQTLSFNRQRIYALIIPIAFFVAGGVLIPWFINFIDSSSIQVSNPEKSPTATPASENYKPNVRVYCNDNLLPSNAKNILTACEKISEDDADYGALRNKGRALVVLWGSKPPKERDNDLLDKAINSLDKAIKKSNKQDPKSLFYYAIAYSLKHFIVNRGEREIQLAREAYDDAFKIYKNEKFNIDESDYIPINEIGHFKTKQCQFPDAIQMYNRVLNKEVRHYGALASKAIALFQDESRNREGNATGSAQPDYQEAERLLTLVDDLLEHKSPDVQFNLGSIAASKGDYKKAVEHFDNAITLPSNTEFFSRAWRGKGFSLLLSGQDQEAVETFDIAISKFKDKDKNYDEYSRLVKGRAYANWRLKKFEDANSDFKAINHTSVDLTKPAPSKEELQKLFRNLFGAVSIHEDYEGAKDPVVDVDHDKLYPGVEC